MKNKKNMKKAVDSLVINFFLDSHEFEFRDFDMDKIIVELEPLLKSTISNYLYLKKTNPTDLHLHNVNFIGTEKEKFHSVRSLSSAERKRP